MNVKNPHDLIFRQIESHIENAIDYIRGTCPLEFVQNLDMTTLCLDESSYTTTELKEYFSDLVYQCKYKGDKLIKITLLFEHKSYIQDYPLFQILKYIINIWETQLKEKQVFTPVIPILFYHGKEEWKIKKFSAYFEGIDDFLLSFIPCFDIIFTDISRQSDGQIKNQMFKREANKILFLLMKHIFHFDYLKNHLKEFLEIGKKYFESEEGTGFLKSILIYLYSSNKFEINTIVSTLKEISEEGGELAMTTALKLKEEGKIEGRIEAALKMLEHGLDINLIADCTGLSVEEIEKLKKT